MIKPKSIDNDFGYYRAIVAENQDKLKLGRVKVRIPCFHGTKEEGKVPDKDLPYANISMVGASPQSGAFIVPEVDSTVLVVFENGNHSSPIVLGSLYSRGYDEIRKVDQSPDAYMEEDYSGSYDSSGKKGRMVPAGEHDVIDDARQDTAVRLVYQSPKGAKYQIRDTDGSEETILQDANKQCLRFISPMESDKTKDNKHKRKPPKDNLLSRATTLLSNSLGQILKFVGDGDKGDIDLVDTLTTQGVEIDGDEKKTRLFNHSGVKIEVYLKDDKVVLRSPGAYVEVSPTEVTIKGAKITLESPSIVINGTKITLNGETTTTGALITTAGCVAGGVDLSAHTHTAPHGETSTQHGPSASGGPSFSAPSVDIEKWEEEKA